MRGGEAAESLGGNLGDGNNVTETDFLGHFKDVWRFPTSSDMVAESWTVFLSQNPATNANHSTGTVFALLYYLDLGNRFSLNT